MMLRLQYEMGGVHIENIKFCLHQAAVTMENNSCSMNNFS